MVVALGITWILDGLQVMLAAAVVGAIWAVPAEPKQLEAVSRALASVD